MIYTCTRCETETTTIYTWPLPKDFVSEKETPREALCPECMYIEDRAYKRAIDEKRDPDTPPVPRKNKFKSPYRRGELER